MNSTTFLGLDIATRGLYAAQRGMSTVNHNVNNVNTPGYSRQQIIQRASTPMLSADGAGMLGMGSEVISVESIRDKYLDYKYWSEHQSLGEWEVKRSLMEDLQATFNEPSTSGFNTIMNDFYSSLQKLASDPSDSSTRAMVREAGVTVAKYYNSMAVHLERLQDSIDQSIDATVTQINFIADEIAQTNRQIYSLEAKGGKANDLRDHRNYLVDTLSKLINVDAYEVKSGTLPDGSDDMKFVVTISGKDLVNHFDVVHLETVQRDTKLNEEDVDNLYQIKWEDGNKIDIKSGELKGYLDVRDGNDGENGSPEYRGIPYYQRKLNEFVRVLARTLNEGIIDTDGDGVLEDTAGHVDGYTLDSEEGDSPAGIRFFTMLDENGDPMDSAAFINGASSMSDIIDEYDKLTAKNISISLEIDTDAENCICTSSEAAEAGNIEVLNSIMEMRHNPYMFIEGAPEDFMKTIVSGMGVDGQQAIIFEDSQTKILNQIENHRISTSGVSLNEEMTNLIKYQHAYNAAAKIIQTYQELLEVLINRTGL